MFAVARAAIIAMLALAGCSKPAEQAAQDNAAATDIETLPADESVATSSEELANGAADVPADSNLAVPTEETGENELRIIRGDEPHD